MSPLQLLENKTWLGLHFRSSVARLVEHVEGFPSQPGCEWCNPEWDGPLPEGEAFS